MGLANELSFLRSNHGDLIRRTCRKYTWQGASCNSNGLDSDEIFFDDLYDYDSDSFGNLSILTPPFIASTIICLSTSREICSIPIRVKYIAMLIEMRR